MYRVAINGLGRIGRATLKILLETPELELVGMNDLVPPNNLAYLLKYDSVYGRYEKKVEAGEGNLVINGKNYPIYGFLMEPIGWLYAGYIWAYALITILLVDAAKMLTYEILEKTGK